MKKLSKKINIKIFIACLLIVFSVAFIGSLFTSGNSDSQWYDSVKPNVTPPSIVFPIVWNILFFLIALSLYFSLTKIRRIKNKTKRKKQKKRILSVFGINFILNILWSLVFFELKLTQLAFFELILLLISIVLMITTTRKISKTASYLLIPYLIWVAFAGILNFLIAF